MQPIQPSADEKPRPTAAARRRSKRQRTAAEEIAYGDAKGHEIAAALGINRRTLTRWKKQPHFQQAVQEVAERWDEVQREDTAATLEKILAEMLERSSGYFPTFPTL